MRMLLKWHGARRDERGQVLLIVAGGLVIFLLFAGLVIDTGIGFRERRTAQNISDLGAMAGTRQVAQMYLDPNTPVTGADVYAAIEGNVMANGCTNPCTWEAEYVRPNGTGETQDLGAVEDSGAVPAGAQGVRVTVNRNPETFFMRLVGIESLEVATAGTALTSQLEPPPGGILLPIGVFDADYQVGNNYQLTEGTHGPGNFGWMSWFGSPSSVALVESLCNPNNPAFTFPAWFDGATGVMNSSGARACLDRYIDEQTVVYVPIWKQTNNRGGSNLQYEITGVAAWVLTDYDRHAVTVNGTFVEFYSYPSVPAGFGAPPCSATTNATCNERTNFIGLVR
jgi:Flp pilus assembly protein TadG